MKHLLPVFTLTLLLAACGVDTTGLSKESSKPPLGNPNASVLVEVYSDFQCPSCRTAETAIVKPLIAEMGSRLRLEFRQFPLKTHVFSSEAAQASECAADQGKFWDYIDVLFERQEQISSKNLRTWAQEMQLDVPLLDRCIRSGIKKEHLKASYDEGISRGVQGTPTFFVQGKQVDGSLDAIQAAVTEAETQMRNRL